MTYDYVQVDGRPVDGCVKRRFATSAEGLRGPQIFGARTLWPLAFLERDGLALT